MKGRSVTLLGILAAIVGAALIIFKDKISIDGLTLSCGVMFVGVGIINLIFFGGITREGRDMSRILTLIANAGAIVLGISMLVFKGVYAPMIAFMLGLLIAVCALWQFFVLAIGARPYQLPAWLYLFPIVLTICTIYIFIIKSTATDADLMLTTGCSMAFLGLACIIEGSMLGIARRRHLKELAANTEADKADSDKAKAISDSKNTNTDDSHTEQKDS